MYSCKNSNCYSLHKSPKIRLLLTTLILIGSFSIIEFIVALSSHSLALKAESGHTISDSFALVLALLASWLASNKFSANKQIEIWAALINGLGLLIMGGLIIWEALKHFQAPPLEIFSLPMLITASVGLIINIVNAFLLHGDSSKDINLRGAFLHIVADVISSLGVILAALCVWLFNFYWADTIISIAVAILITISAIPLVYQSFKTLFNKKTAIENYLLSISEIIKIENSQLEHNMFSVSLLVKPTFVAKEIEEILQKKFALNQVNLKINSLLELGKIDLSYFINKKHFNTN